MSLRAWSGTRSAFCGTTRSKLRTTGDRRPPRQRWDRSCPPALFVAADYPPPTYKYEWWGSGSRLPVKSGGVAFMKAGRTGVGELQPQVVGW